MTRNDNNSIKLYFAGRANEAKQRTHKALNDRKIETKRYAN